MSEVTIPRLLEATRSLGIDLVPTTTIGLWAANLNDQLFQFALLPSQAIIRVDVGRDVTAAQCNAVNASALLASAARLDGKARVEHTFPTAAGLDDAQLSLLLKEGINHIFAALKMLQP